MANVQMGQYCPTCHLMFTGVTTPSRKEVCPECGVAKDLKRGFTSISEKALEEVKPLLFGERSCLLIAWPEGTRYDGAFRLPDGRSFRHTYDGGRGPYEDKLFVEGETPDVRMQFLKARQAKERV